MQRNIVIPAQIREPATSVHSSRAWCHLASTVRQETVQRSVSRGRVFTKELQNPYAGSAMGSRGTGTGAAPIPTASHSSRGRAVAHSLLRLYGTLPPSAVGADSIVI